MNRVDKKYQIISNIDLKVKMPISFICDKSRLISIDTVQNYLEESFAINHFANSGPCVSKLEEIAKEKFGILQTKSVIATCSGTSALHALICSLLITKRCNKFATQSFTFPSSAQQVLNNVEIIDIDKEGGLDLNLVPQNIECIIVTNCFGHLVNIDKYVEWSQSRGILLIFDNAATPSTYWHGENSLNYGNGAIVSFHHTKPIGFGEGGIIIVDSELEDTVRACINYGYNKKKRDILYNKHGSNFKMSDITAAFILSFNESFVKIKSKHEELYLQFINKIKDIDGVKLFPSYAKVPFSNCLPVLFNKPVQIEQFTENGICAHKYYKPLANTPTATSFYERVVCLPLHIDINDTVLDYYISIIRQIME